MEHAPIDTIPLDESPRPRMADPFAYRSRKSYRAFVYSLVFHGLLFVLSIGIGLHVSPSDDTANTPKSAPIKASLYQTVTMPDVPDTPALKAIPQPEKKPVLPSEKKAVVADVPPPEESAPSGENTKRQRIDEMLAIATIDTDTQRNVVPSGTLKYEAESAIDVRRKLDTLVKDVTLPPPERSEPDEVLSDTDPVSSVVAPATSGKGKVGEVDPLLVHHSRIAQQIESQLRVDTSQVAGCVVILRLSQDGLLLNVKNADAAFQEQCQPVVAATFRVVRFDVPADPKHFRYLERLRVTIH